ncbi:hypothetical protein CEXT_166411 [Caerostris extrusa]|uniref:Uncharacterized protein n=1 Tax=Caerostris extrusa TaxID=172846 RepID=A0AAV4V7L9_CAEEX|nr:hypothetical protein CEXT_166411 [Caerostris extrusa]
MISTPRKQSSLFFYQLGPIHPFNLKVPFLLNGQSATNLWVDFCARTTCYPAICKRIALKDLENTSECNGGITKLLSLRFPINLDEGPIE